MGDPRQFTHDLRRAYQIISDDTKVVTKARSFHHVQTHFEFFSRIRTINCRSRLTISSMFNVQCGTLKNPHTIRKEKGVKLPVLWLYLEKAISLLVIDDCYVPPSINEAYTYPYTCIPIYLNNRSIFVGPLSLRTQCLVGGDSSSSPSSSLAPAILQTDLPAD